MSVVVYKTNPYLALFDKRDTGSGPDPLENLAWAAASSKYMIDPTNKDADKHEFQAQVIGKGAAPTFDTPDGLLLPDYEGVYHGNKQNTMPVYGSRVVTNSAIQSEDFSAGNWNKLQCTVTPNATTAPDGESTADALFETADNNIHVITDILVNAANGVASFYVKANGTNFVAVNSVAGPGLVVSNLGVFDLANGLFVSKGTEIDEAGISDVGNGWYRCFVSSADSDRIQLWLMQDATTLSYVGNPANGVYVWGAQFEDATGRSDTDILSEYIPTTTDPVTKYYSNLNGNTVSNNVVTEAVGLPFDNAGGPYDESPFNGARVVGNTASYSNDFSQAVSGGENCTLTTGIADPVGGNAATRVTATGTNPVVRFQGHIGLGNVGKTIRVSYYIRDVNWSGFNRVYDGQFGVVDVSSAVTTDWRRITVTGIANVVDNGSLGVNFNAGQVGEEFDIYGFACQVVGDINEAPGEYIETTGTPLEKYYTTANGNTVTDNVVTEAVGDPLLEFPSLYAAPAMENLVTYSRDLTNAAWTKFGAPTTTYDQVGITGAPNTATLCNDNNANFGQYRQAFTQADDSNPFVVVLMVKKDSDETRFPYFRSSVSGGTAINDAVKLNTTTGDIDTDGVSPSGVAEVESAGDWWRLYIQTTNNSTGNTVSAIDIYPAYDSTIGGGGDSAVTGSIVIGNIEKHDNKTIAQIRGAAPIVTSGVAVTNSWVDIRYDDANHNDDGMYYAEWTPQSSDGDDIGFIGSSNTSQILNDGQAAGTIRTTSGAQLSQITGLTLTPGTPKKMAVASNLSTDALFILNVDGVYGTERPFTGWTLANPYVYLLNDFNGSQAPGVPALIRNVQRWDLDYAAAKAKIDELMS